MTTRQFRAAAIAVFVLALSVRVLHVWQIRAAPFFTVLMGDSRGYDEWAQRIAAGDWLGHEVFYQAPLYPYFLGTIYAIAGRHLMLVRLVQAVLGSASCLLLALAAARLFSPAVGIVAGVMLALYAPAIFFDGLIQKSGLDVFFVCLALLSIATVAARRVDNPPRRSSRTEPPALRAFFGLGLALGGLALTRENALVLIAVILVWAVRQYSARAAAVFVAGVAVLLLPVAARNAYVGGGFYITTSQAGPNFYIGNNPNADGTYQSLRVGRGAPEFERQDATDLAEHALGRSLSPAEVSTYWSNRAFDFIASQPLAWLRLMARKTALLVNRAEVVDTESQASHAEWSLPLRLLGPIGHFGVLIPLALIGIVATFRSPGDPARSPLVLLYALMIAYAASVVVFYVFARYRYPLVPFLLPFAAAGALTSIEALRVRAMPGGRWTLAGCAAAAIAANWPMISTDWMQAVTESNLGVALQAEHRIDEAEAHYRRAIALRPNYAPAYSNLGTALRAEGRLDDSVAAYERALALLPDFPDAQYNLANALVDEGKADEAIHHFTLALREIPGSAEVHNNLGIALAAKGRNEEAIAEFRAALAADPDSVKAHRNLGDLLERAGHQAEAIDHLRRAVDLAPGDAAMHYDFGGVLLDAGRMDEAIKEFRASLAIAPSSPDAMNNLGIALGSQGKLDEAIAQFQQALKLRPGFSDAQRNLAMALSAKRRSG